MRKAVARSVSVALGIAIVGCREAVGPVGATYRESKLARSQALGSHAITFLSYLSQVPGFGGMYYDGNEDLVIFLKDSSQSARARGVFANLVGKSGRPAALPPLKRPPSLRFLPARYDYNELLDLKGRVAAALAPAKILTAIGVDDARNSVMVGVVNGAVAQSKQILAATGISLDGIELSVGEPIHVLSGDTIHTNTISNRVMGGWQILQGGSECTLGLVVLYGANSVPGYLSAGHCADTVGAPTYRYDGTNTATLGSIVDKGDVPYSCSYGKCVTADVSLMNIASGVGYWYGGIVEGVNTAIGPYCAPIPGGQQCYSATGYYSSNWGDPLAYDPVLDSASTVSPPFQVDLDENTTVTVGTWVGKYGRTTGWTQGKVVQADIDQPRSTDGAYVLHTVRVAAGAWAGDSGSPAFYGDANTVGGNYGAEFFGIVWGGDSTITAGGHSVYSHFVYSPITQIRSALSYSISTHQTYY